MPGKPNSDDGAWVRGAVARFESPLTPWTLPHAFMTHESLDAITTTWSTPLEVILSRFSM